MANNDTVKKTLLVAVSLCVVCALIVSGAAVSLKPMQDENKALDVKRNILAAAGMLQEGIDIDEQFASVKPKMVDLRTGKYTSELAVENYNQLKAAKDPELSDALDDSVDIAKIFRREHYSLVYVVEKNGSVDKLILPVRGYGLWGTLYGFLALEGDANTVVGLGFYEHNETPGLGGEVDNPRWKSLWTGKQVYKDGEAVLKLIKGSVNPAAADANYLVDGLSGATLTSRGVSNLISFWMSESGYQKFLTNLRSGEA